MTKAQPVETREIFKKEYDCESLYDLGRDVEEAVNVDFNEKMKNLPGMKEHPEFSRGKFTVTIVWKDNRDD